MGSKYRHSQVSLVLAVVIGVLGTAVLGVASPAYADPHHDAGERAARSEAILENATALARTAADRLDSATSALPGARQNVAISHGLVVAAQVAANTAQRAANVARVGYGAVAGRFEVAQGRLEEARQRVDDAAAATYKGGNFATINMLVEATGPQDVIDRLDLADQIMQKQHADAVAMTAARWVARSEQDQAGLAKRAAETTAQVAKDKLAAAKSAQAAAVRAQATVIALANARSRAYAQAQAQRGAVLVTYRQARDEETRIEAALRGGGHQDGVVSSISSVGTLLMPVQGWKSSDFGERYDPYYRVWQLHAGADFAADGGSPIRAAADGRVVRAGWNGGYGNYTCLDHGTYRGQEFDTCYGHQSKILVDVGEYVHRGDIIGLVGTTGASTGYHLHFETRFDGVPRNPLPYLPACLC